MNDVSRHPDEVATNAHEPDRLSVVGVVWTTAGLVALVGITLLMMYAWLAALEWGIPVAPISNVVKLPPETPKGALLIPDQQRQLRTMRQQEEALLNRYQWVDRGAGIARIPIDRAMKILAEEGLSGPNISGQSKVQSNDN